MSAALARRVLGLGCVALLGALAALALASRGHSLQHALPQPASAWYPARAVAVSQARPHRSACGQRVDGETQGVAHAVLPCNTKIFLDYGGKRVLTHVVDRTGSSTRVPFQLTRALAVRIGARGTIALRWAFAG